MAKQKTEIDVAGLTLRDVIELDPSHIKGLSNKSLARLTSRLVSAYNKRAKRLEQSGLADVSPAYRGLVKEGKTRLSVKGLTRNDLVSVFADAKRLLTERKTFSVAGTRAVMREAENRLGYRFRTKEEALRFWEAMDKLKEMGIGVDNRTSTDVQREVADMMFNEDQSIDDILRAYGVIQEAQTPSFTKESSMLFGLGEEEEIEEEGFDIYETPPLQ